MLAVLRYLVIAFGVVILACAFVVCAEGTCDTCAHSCCVRSEAGLDRPRSLLGRLLALCASCVSGFATACSAVSSRLVAVAETPSLSPSLVLALAPLRI